MSVVTKGRRHDGRPRRWSSPATWVGITAAIVPVGAFIVWWPHFADRSEDSYGFDTLGRFLLAVSLVILLCHSLAALLRPAGQPAVVGEILGGICLGPSVLGLLWSAGQHWLFRPEVIRSLQTTAQLGLVVFMFLVGCELRLEHGGAGYSRAIPAIVAGGFVLPFSIGALVAWSTRSSVLAVTAPRAGGVLVFGLAMAITALPVLARILVDLKLNGTAVGTLVLSAAATGDGLAWVVLTFILVLNGLGSGGFAVVASVMAVAFVVATLLFVRQALVALVRRAECAPDREQLLLPVLGVAIGFAAISHALGLHPAIGAFLFGLAVPDRSALVGRINQRLTGLTITVLLPLFFASVGLDVSLGLLRTPYRWLLFAAILMTAVAAKFVGAGFGARLSGLPTREAMRVGALMNCRGVTELVVATIALRYRLVNEFGFTVLVLMALVTTAMTVPLTRLVDRVRLAS
jgi:Kef-type K+ transport system membrane component KefB